MKDWTGNKRTLGALLGASNHTSEERQREDYYATDPAMVRDLLNAGAPLRKHVWEPACGAGHIVNVLRERGHEVYATDIVDRGCPGAGRPLPSGDQGASGTGERPVDFLLAAPALESGGEGRLFRRADPQPGAASFHVRRNRLAGA